MERAFLEKDSFSVHAFLGRICGSLKVDRRVLSQISWPNIARTRNRFLRTADLSYRPGANGKVRDQDSEALSKIYRHQRKPLLFVTAIDKRALRSGRTDEREK